MVAVPPKLRFPALDQIRRERARKSLAQFTLYTKPDYTLDWFHADLARELDQFYADVVAKRSPRLMIFAPPQHGKTELASRRFPAAALGRSPDLRFIAASYASDLSSRINRDVQRVIDAPDYAELYPDTCLFGKNVRTVAQNSWLRNNDIFEIVNHHGSYRSAGIGVGIAGMPADILLIDDPVKDAAEAFSVTIRNSLWEWYLMVARPRVQSGGGIVIIMTRWHEDDLCGRLLKLAKEDSSADQWRVVSYAAEAEADEKNRKKGEALSPCRYTSRDLAAIRANMGPTRFNSLYQQRPSAMEGNIFKRGFIKTIPRDMVKPERTIISWDTAFGKSQASGAFSVSLCMQLFDKGIFIHSRMRGRFNYSALKEATYGQAAMITDVVGLEALLIEDKASGQSLVQDARQDTRLPVKPIEPDGDKIVRANVCVPYVESGRLYGPMDPDTGLPEPWFVEFCENLYSFPNAEFKDDMDALTQGIKYLVLGGAGTGFIEWVLQQVAKDKAQALVDRLEDAAHHPVEYIELGGATSPRRH